MKKTSKAASAESIAKLADSGKSVSRFFTGKGKMMQPLQVARSIQRVNVDFAPGMLEELDREAFELNISRQAVIKSLLRNALDQRRVAAAKSV